MHNQVSGSLLEILSTPCPRFGIPRHASNCPPSASVWSRSSRNDWWFARCTIYFGSIVGTFFAPFTPASFFIALIRCLVIFLQSCQPRWSDPTRLSLCTDGLRPILSSDATCHGQTYRSCRKANSSILTRLNRSTLRFSAERLCPSNKAILALNQHHPRSKR